MIKHDHAWGTSWDIYRDKSVWVVGFKGFKGGASSKHYHDNMTHTVYVQDGSMGIYGSVFLAQVMRETMLEWIPAKLPHALVFHKDTEGIETYYALPGHEIDENDIVRLSPAKSPDCQA